MRLEAPSRGWDETAPGRRREAGQMSSTTVSGSPSVTGRARREISGRVLPERGQPVVPGKAAQLRARLRAARSPVGGQVPTYGAPEPSGHSDRWPRGHSYARWQSSGEPRRHRGGERRRRCSRPWARPQERETTAVSDDQLRSRGPGDAPATSPPDLSIDISRELATVVVTLDGLLDEDSSPALVELLWDLVVGQGNLSVAVDARRLTSSDPALLCMFQVLDWEAGLRGGTLAVVQPPPPSASAERNRTVAVLDQTRARRAAALGRAAHPAGGARTTQSNGEKPSMIRCETREGRRPGESDLRHPRRRNG